MLNQNLTITKEEYEEFIRDSLPELPCCNQCEIRFAEHIADDNSMLCEVCYGLIS